MAYIIDENGNITCYQGDTIKLPITGIDTAYNYTLCLQIRDENHKVMGQEQAVLTNRLPDIIFIIPAALTDTLTVPNGQETETYYYGVKLVKNTGEEDTLFLGSNTDFDTENTITVYPKKVDGQIIQEST